MKHDKAPIQMIDLSANFEFVAGQTYCTGIYGASCESITIEEIITDSKGQRFAVVTSKGFIVTKDGEKIQSYEVKTVKRKIKTMNFEYREGTYESFRLGQTQYNGKMEKKMDTVMAWCSPELVTSCKCWIGDYKVANIDC